jgi:hypothetical protein
VTTIATAEDRGDACFGPDGVVVPDEHGTLPTCTVADDGTVTLDYPDAPGAGMPASFVALFVLVLVLGIAGTAWRVSTARSLARRSGLDEQSAASMAMLTDHGLEATYLASSLREQPTPGTAPAAAADRLKELRSLLDRGLITQAEHDERRAQIISSI